jgi:LmbE family N-acetylglucosaminyl deacetylase
MAEQPLRLMVFGAHPDDADLCAGGLAMLYVARGHQVRFVSVTNGDAGHHELGGGALARRRRQEVHDAAAVAGIEYEVMDNHDGELEPSLANRRVLIRAIRDFAPDLLLTHRPWDYHPDHRYTSVLVQDACFLVSVPNICSDTPALQRLPVVAYFSDGFRTPTPFRADVAVDIDAVAERKIDMIHCHTSQMYEWLPYLAGHLDEVPTDEAPRRLWLGRRLERYVAAADRWRDVLTARYGDARGQAVRHAEAFEACEYGSPLTAAAASLLFP